MTLKASQTFGTNKKTVFKMITTSLRLYHTKQRGNVTVSYGYPDDPDPLTILFDTEATVDKPEDLPELFIDLAKELNTVKDKEKLC